MGGERSVLWELWGQNMTFGGLRKKEEKKKKKKKKWKIEKKRKKKKRDFSMRLYTHYNTLSSALLEIFGRDGGLFSSPVIASCWEWAPPRHTYTVYNHTKMHSLVPHKLSALSLRISAGASVSILSGQKMLSSIDLGSYLTQSYRIIYCSVFDERWKPSACWYMCVHHHLSTTEQHSVLLHATSATTIVAVPCWPALRVSSSLSSHEPRLTSSRSAGLFGMWAWVGGQGRLGMYVCMA